MQIGKIINLILHMIFQYNVMIITMIMADKTRTIKSWSKLRVVTAKKFILTVTRVTFFEAT